MHLQNVNGMSDFPENSRCVSDTALAVQKVGMDVSVQKCSFSSTTVTLNT